MKPWELLGETRTPEGSAVRLTRQDNEYVILAMTFSKPMAPGLKTGYGVLPTELVGPLLRFKGNHDFGSGNFNQYVIDRLIETGAYARHVVDVQDAYRVKAAGRFLSTSTGQWVTQAWTYSRPLNLHNGPQTLQGDRRRSPTP